MIKFFRKIRQKMLTQNKISKYLLYALGEIVLVVIGILIALSINNRNEQHKNEKITVSILKEIQKNLLDDINNAQVDMDDFLKSFKTQLEILNFDNPRTADRYIKGEYETLGTRYSDFVINKNGYESLITQIDKLPLKYTSVLHNLKELYVAMNEIILVSNNRIRNVVYTQIDFINDQNWYVHRIKHGKASQAEIDYYVNDDNFKSYIIKFMNDRFVVFRSCQRYRLKAIETYLEIDSLLEVSLPHNHATLTSLGMIQSETKFEKYTGRYHIKGQITSTNIQFNIENNQFYMIKNDNQTTKRKVYHLNDKTFMYMNDSDLPVVFEFLSDSQGNKSISFIFGAYEGYKALSKKN